MARLEDIDVVIKLKTTISFWDAVKLRLSGAGYAVKQFIEVDVQERADAAERDRLAS